MKKLLFFIFVVCAQISFAQYTFKYESTITELTEVGVEKNASKKTVIDGTSNGVVYYSKTYKTNSGDTLTIRPKISIYVKNDDEIDKVVKQFGNKLSFNKKVGWVFVFDCNVSNSDEVLVITTQLSKDKNVIACDAFTDIRMESFNTLYSKQYYLHDNTTGNVGINMESSWEIASGQNITVAVIDEGVEHDHEDLSNVLDGYTAGNTSGKGDPIASAYAHGVACAGIIGGADNSIGIKGIAPNVKILPVNICTSWNSAINKYEYVSEESIADAIIWASERADVLSCSWGNGDGRKSAIITLAIKKAMTEGRNGKGCVVVFASGNYAQDYNNLSFPASVEGVISVGAVDKTGKIWNYSQRGKGLSLVAPSGNGNSSSDIVTTDRMGSLGYVKGNYTEHFNGTSAACPQVSGVAALLLSIRPDLTAAEVKDVLQRTATDLGSTGYDTTYGHGLLNAYASLKEVAPAINGSDVAKSKSTYKIDNFPETASVSWSVNEKDKNNITLNTSGQGNLNCTAELNGTKTVKTTLTAVVKVGGLIVATLNKNIVLLGTFSGTYSVPAKTINGISFPAIVNRPFTEGSTLQARAGSSVTINSEDLNYYTASWSGNPITNWTRNLTTLNFAYPQTAKSTTTILKFQSKIGGTVTVNVVPIQPPTPPTMNLSHDGTTLSVIITKEKELENLGYIEFADIADSTEYKAEKTSELSVNYSDANTWTIEVLNATTGAVQDKTSTPSGEYQFDTSRWQPGIYIVHASNGIETISKKITIK